MVNHFCARVAVMPRGLLVAAVETRARRALMVSVKPDRDTGRDTQGRRGLRAPATQLVVFLSRHNI